MSKRRFEDRVKNWKNKAQPRKGKRVSPEPAQRADGKSGCLEGEVQAGKTDV